MKKIFVKNNKYKDMIGILDTKFLGACKNKVGWLIQTIVWVIFIKSSGQNDYWYISEYIFIFKSNVYYNTVSFPWDINRTTSEMNLKVQNMGQNIYKNNSQGIFVPSSTRPTVHCWNMNRENIRVWRGGEKILSTGLWGNKLSEVL